MNAPAHQIEIPDKILRLHGSAFVADPSGVLYWPSEHLLVVADLHLEKGSSYAARRVFLPPYDTSATLARLAVVIARLNPKRVIALGDSFHDCGAAARLLPHDVQTLRAMQTGREWLWIAGNHDPAAPAGLDGDHATELWIGPMCFRHEPSASRCEGEIAGHLHPVAIVGGQAGSVRRRCFVTDGLRCVMPAFGAYAGGLNMLDPAFDALFAARQACDVKAGDLHAYVLGRDTVYRVGRRQCLLDRRSDAISWR